jgi:hypothetical protein
MMSESKKRAGVGVLSVECHLKGLVMMYSQRGTNTVDLDE